MRVANQSFPSQYSKFFVSVLKPKVPFLEFAGRVLVSQEGIRGMPIMRDSPWPISKNIGDFFGISKPLYDKSNFKYFSLFFSCYETCKEIYRYYFQLSVIFFIGSTSQILPSQYSKFLVSILKPKVPSFTFLGRPRVFQCGILFWR